MTTKNKIANAVRVAGSLYQITYPGRAECDGPVPYSYLERLARDGYTVTVDQGSQRGVGEPKSFTVDAD